jgi:hypothetical protein
MKQNTHYEKNGCFAIGLATQFWIAPDIYNSLYLYTMSANKQVAWVVGLQLIVYTVQLIVTQLQLCQNNSFSTTMQLHHNCTHDVMLTSLIVIHPFKFNTWHYEYFWIFFFGNIHLHHPLWLLMMVWNCDMWHNFLKCHMAC